ncbi:MAG: hypothetical protein ACREMW_10230 [Gemmatimonadales bacterium]
MSWTALASVLWALPLSAPAQEPIFITPPVTMYQSGLVVGADIEGQGRTVAFSSAVAFGVLSPWTVSLHAVGIDPGGASPAFARLHVGTRVRLVKLDRPRQWMLVSVYGAAALPLGDRAEAVARTYRVPQAVLGVSATRMARRGDAFLNLEVARIETVADVITSATVGLALGWRPKPGKYGDLETQLFGEALGRYVEGGQATFGLAPGILVHSRKVVLKLGALFPAWTRGAPHQITVRLGTRLLL